ncbi:MAG: GNAT family N-acetyltransferase [Syntrophotaleaceae bacterium]
MVLITPAEPNDAEVILALQKRAYQSEARLYNDWNIPPLTQTLPALRDEIETAIVLKAVKGRTIVGSVRASVTERVCSIGRLIVEPEFQGQGIGTMLLKAIEGAVPKVNRFELFTGSRSERNIRLYLRHGYQITRHERLSMQVTLVYMSKCAHSRR